MPTKLGNGGTSQEAYNPQDGKYTDEGNISKDERYEKYLQNGNLDWDEVDEQQDWRNIAYPVNTEQSKKIKEDFFNSGYQTEDGTPTVDEIYNEFVFLKGKEPENLEELIGFVKEEVQGFLEYGMSKGYSFNEIKYKSPYLVKLSSKGTNLPPNKKEEVQALKILNSNGTQKPGENKFDEYYEEYDWAYEHLENLIDNNDFGYPEFEELEEEERDGILQEAFVRYLDDGNDFNSSMGEDAVLAEMYNYIEEIMNENQSNSKKPENNSYLNFMRRNDYGFDYSQKQNHPERTWQHGEQLYNRRNNKNKKQLFPID